jgi:hypothetical protein
MNAFFGYIRRLGGLGGGENFGHLWPQKGEERIGLVTSHQELRVSVRVVQAAPVVWT